MLEVKQAYYLEAEIADAESDSYFPRTWRGLRWPNQLIGIRDALKLASSVID